MTGARYLWRVKQNHELLSARLARDLDLSPVTARVLVNRGITTPEEVRRFLRGGTGDLHPPFLLKDTDLGVSRILEAVERGERITVYGDYDVDGVTGTALLYLTLKKLGARVDYYIPSRLEEGYGLHGSALEELAGKGVGLLVTVDCGISAWEEVKYAARLGMDVVVTDHHEAGAILPEAAAVINPKRRECSYPFKGLAGVGVAYKLAQALFVQAGMGGEELGLLDLVALGTVADVVPLLDENRILVAQGLKVMASGRRPGLLALGEKAGLDLARVGSGHLAFVLGPRLNAVGRLGEALKSVSLLTTGDLKQARALAEDLEGKNRRRQELEAQILREAVEIIDREVDLEQNRVLVLASTGWHEGVIGIVASRLVERYYRPVVLVALEGEIGKGSARSIPGFDLYQALNQCGYLLERYGGHEGAAGFSIRASNLEVFREKLNRLAFEWLSAGDLVPVTTVDGEVGADDLDIDLARELRGLEPFGLGNPAPVLLCRGLEVSTARKVGKNGDHWKIRFKTPYGSVLEGIGFKLSDRGETMIPSDGTVEVLFSPEVNTWNGRESLQLKVRDLRPVSAVEAVDVPLVPTVILEEVAWTRNPRNNPEGRLQGGGSAGSGWLKERLRVLPVDPGLARECWESLAARRGFKVSSPSFWLRAWSLEAASLLAGPDGLVVFVSSSVAELITLYEGYTMGMGKLGYGASLVHGLKEFTGGAWSWGENRGVMFTTPNFLAAHPEAFVHLVSRVKYVVIDRSGGMTDPPLSPGGIFDQLRRQATVLEFDPPGATEGERDGVPPVPVVPFLQGLTGGPVHDQRNHQAKVDALADLLAGTGGGRTLVLAGDGGRAQGLAGYLRRQGLEPVVFLAETDFGPKDGQQFEGEKTCLVCPYHLLGAVQGVVERVVLFDLPYTIRQLAWASQVTGFQAEKGELYLLYGPGDLDLNRLGLQLLAPGVEELRAIYRVLRDTTGIGKAFKVDAHLLARVRRRCGLQGEGPIWGALKIFTELGLVSRRKGDGEEPVWTLNPHQGRKIDLDKSLRYREGEEQKKGFETLARWALS